MVDKTVVSARIDEAVARKLDALADATGRSKAYHAAEAIAAYVEAEDWQISAIRAAIDEVDAGGERIEHGHVKAWLETWGDEAETPPPA